MNTIELKLAGSDDFFTQEAYKVLRTNLQFCGQDIQVVAITSCYENEGKTITSLNLGKTLAELGKKVLVIDADMRKSVMAGRNTTAQNVVGLSEVLTGMRSFEDSIYQTQYPTLQLLFSGQYPPNPVELLGGRYFGELIDDIRKEYDYIIIDTPPLRRVIDAAVISPECDGTILVLGDGTARFRDVQEVVAQINRTDGKILGVVMNKAKKKNRAYYSRGRYGYSKKYAYSGTKEKKDDSLKRGLFRVFGK